MPDALTHDVSSQDVQPAIAMLPLLDDPLAESESDRLTRKMQRLLQVFVSNHDEFSKDQASTVDHLITGLAAKAPPQARKAVAEEIACNPKAPPGLVQHLAEDDRIAVAEPVLKHSPCLSDAALLDLIHRKGHSHLVAISRRETIATEVADMLVECGNRTVIRTLARNPGAKLSKEGRVRLAQRQSTRLDELRKAPRREIAYPALLRVVGETKAFRCRIIDISVSGAKLALATMIQPKGRLQLNLGSAAVIRTCEPVWQDGHHIGVRFV